MVDQKSPSLTDLLPEERVSIDFEAQDWRAAVREAGRLLFESGAVKEEYGEAMIKTAEELGPYIVIAKGIALPHAAPDKGVIHTALSLVKLNPTVEFGNPDNDPVNIVIGLAAVDHHVHIEALRTLAEIFIDESLRDRLLQADGVSEITEIIKTGERKRSG